MKRLVITLGVLLALSTCIFISLVRPVEAQPYLDIEVSISTPDPIVVLPDFEVI